METPVEMIVRILRGNGQTDAQNADTARRILAGLAEPDVRPAVLTLLAA